MAQPSLSPTFVRENWGIRQLYPKYSEPIPLGSLRREDVEYGPGSSLLRIRQSDYLFRREGIVTELFCDNIQLECGMLYYSNKNFQVAAAVRNTQNKIIYVSARFTSQSIDDLPWSLYMFIPVLAPSVHHGDFVDTGTSIVPDDDTQLNLLMYTLEVLAQTQHKRNSYQMDNSVIDPPLDQLFIGSHPLPPSAYFVPTNILAVSACDGIHNILLGRVEENSTLWDAIISPVIDKELHVGHRAIHDGKHIFMEDVRDGIYYITVVYNNRCYDILRCALKDRVDPLLFFFTKIWSIIKPRSVNPLITTPTVKYFVTKISTWRQRKMADAATAPLFPVEK